MKHKHERVRSYACTVAGCDSAFFSLGNLKAHENTHNRDKMYGCEYEGCDAKFTNRDAMKNHMRSHNDMKPFACNVDGCGVACRTLGALNQHKKVHRGLKPWTCEFDGCGKSFLAKENLKVHIRIHSGDRPYACTFDGCGAKFTQPHTLKNHARLHSPEGQARQKKEELKVDRYLKSTFGDNFFVREHFVDYKCVTGTTGFARIDFLVPYIGTGATKGHLFLEVDEHQHEWYPQSCETARMANVTSSLWVGGNTAPIVWLRYNPHGFSVDGVTRRTSSKKRLDTLGKYIKSLSFDGAPDVRVVYMFYDTAAGRPVIFDDPEYDPNVEGWCDKAR